MISGIISSRGSNYGNIHGSNDNDSATTTTAAAAAAAATTTLGAVIRTSDYKETFIKILVSQWVNEFCELTKIAKSDPQAAYSNFTHSLRQKWNFAMRTIPGLEIY